MFQIDGFPWLSDTPNRKELEKLNVEQLLYLCKRHRGIKHFLIDFLMKLKKL